MEIPMQKFVPEGWSATEQNFNLEQLQHAKLQGTVMQGFVDKCDENCNLQIHLGKDIIGVIPRNEIDATISDDFGITKPSICKNKVNQFVQFKVKEIYDENRLLLSRKEARKRGFGLDKKGIKTGHDCQSESLKISGNLGFLLILEEALQDCFISKIFQSLE